MTDVRDVPEFDRWRQQADRTLDTARLADAGDRPEWACFLAEQAAQQAVKGFLHGLGGEAWGHDLIVLSGRAAELGQTVWADVSEPAARLSRHYIPARYPDAHPSGPPGAHYTASDAGSAIEDCLMVLATVDRAWAALSGPASG